MPNVPTPSWIASIWLNCVKNSRNSLELLKATTEECALLSKYIQHLFEFFVCCLAGALLRKCHWGFLVGGLPIGCRADGLPKSAGHPFYQKLNALLAEADFDRWIERCRRSERCERTFAHVCDTGGMRRSWLKESGERQQALPDRRRGAQFGTDHAQTVRRGQAKDVAGPCRPGLACAASAGMALDVPAAMETNHDAQPVELDPRRRRLKCHRKNALLPRAARACWMACMTPGKESA
jgi:hypothetical protein